LKLEKGTWAEFSENEFQLDIFESTWVQMTSA
jgi:hypothetical protein